MTNLTLTRKHVLANNYDEEPQMGVVYLEGDQTFDEGDYIENYWHIRLEASGGCGQHYELDLERSEYHTDDDSTEELSRLEAYLFEHIADENETTAENITIIGEVTQ